MTKENLANFATLWSSCLSMYGREAPAQPALFLAFDALRAFSLDQVRAAIRFYITKNKFAPTPADIIALIEKNTTVDLEAQALSWLRRLDSKIDYAMDYVSCDYRGVRAFKLVYGSLTNYCRMSSYEEIQNKKSFVRMYQTASASGDVLEDCLIPGIYHTGNPTVRLLETYADLRPIIAQIYGNKEMQLSYQSFDPAKPKRVQITMQKQTFTREEQNANIETLYKTLNDMVRGTKPDYL